MATNIAILIEAQDDPKPRAIESKVCPNGTFKKSAPRRSKKANREQGPREVLDAYQVGRVDRHRKSLLPAYADRRSIRSHNPVPVDVAPRSSDPMPACYRSEPKNVPNVQDKGSRMSSKRVQIKRLKRDIFLHPLGMVRNMCRQVT